VSRAKRDGTEDSSGGIRARYSKWSKRSARHFGYLVYMRTWWL